MKALKFSIFFLFLAILPLEPLQARQVINLNRNWLFYAGYQTDPENFATVQLPHVWNTDLQSGNRHGGMGSYVKHLTIPSSWSGKRVYIRFKGVNNQAAVFVNGKYAGEHSGGYTAFTFDITDHLSCGQRNNITVNVSNTATMNVVPTTGSFHLYGGIYRDVELIVTGQNHISLTDFGSDGIYLIPRKVTGEQADMEALVKLDIHEKIRDKEELSVQIDVSHSRDTVCTTKRNLQQVSSPGNAEATLPFTIQQPRLWHGTSDPFLYDVNIRLLDKDGNTLDEIDLPLGIRSFHVDNERGFFLNGKPYRLRGVNRHQDRSTVGAALSPLQQEEDIELITELGATAVRLMDGPHDPYFYSLADRNGLIVWSQIPFASSSKDVAANGFVNSRAFKENGERQLIEMIRQLYNHPSILFWGIFDQIGLRGDNPLDYIRQLNKTAHKEDSSRLTVASSDQDGEINFITDLIAWSHYMGWKQGFPSDIALWAGEIGKNWKQLKPALSEYGAGANIFHQEDSLRKPDYKSAWHPERWQTHLHEEYFKIIEKSPFLWGAFIQSLCDYGEASHTAGRSGGISDMGLVTFDRHVKKDAFYFYKANWNDIDPVLYIAQRRWHTRHHPVQNIKVYSNLEAVELWVNGERIGVNTERNNGTFTWNDVPLNNGRNEIVVRSGEFFDHATIHISPQYWHND